MTTGLFFTKLSFTKAHPRTQCFAINFSQSLLPSMYFLNDWLRSNNHKKVSGILSFISCTATGISVFNGYFITIWRRILILVNNVCQIINVLKYFLSVNPCNQSRSLANQLKTPSICVNNLENSFMYHMPLINRAVWVTYHLTPVVKLWSIPSCRT